jgi:hypothetical protein
MYLVTILNALFSANLVSWVRQQKVRPGFKVVYITIFSFFMKNLVGGHYCGGLACQKSTVAVLKFKKNNNEKIHYLFSLSNAMETIQTLQKKSARYHNGICR